MNVLAICLIDVHMPVIFSVMVHVITIEAVKAATHLDQVRHVKITLFNANDGMVHNNIVTNANQSVVSISQRRSHALSVQLSNGAAISK
jgi:hypothetical protein